MYENLGPGLGVLLGGYLYQYSDNNAALSFRISSIALFLCLISLILVKLLKERCYSSSTNTQWKISTIITRGKQKYVKLEQEEDNEELISKIEKGDEEEDRSSVTPVS